MKYPPIVIQGLTDYYKEIVDFYKDYECIWSTWNTEPEENLNYINSRDNFTVVTSDVPKLKYDFHHGLYTWVTTLNGFTHLKNLNHDFGIRVRSDMLVDIPSHLKVTKYDHFNCWGWFRHNVGYLCDFYFSSPVDLMCSLMEKCIEVYKPTFGENNLTYALLKELNWRKINYTLSEETKFMWIKEDRRGKSQSFYMDHVREGRWNNTIDKYQDSENSQIVYNYSVDYFPDDYKLACL
jgi:hypothetical protein